jgi:adenylosuccinate lyase
VFSGRVLLRLVEAGLSREDAYAVVQRNAMRAWDEERPLRALLEADPDASALTPSALDEIFDLESFLVHIDQIFDRTLTTSEVAHV